MPSISSLYFVIGNVCILAALSVTLLRGFLLWRSRALAAAKVLRERGQAHDDQVRELQEQLRAALTDSNRQQEADGAQIRALKAHVQQLLAQREVPGKVPTERTAQLSELCWYGRARYCHTLAKPYLLIEPWATVLTLCCWEVAQRAAGLDVAPVASFVSGLLFELGQHYDDRKTLSAWLQEVKSAPWSSKLPAVPESSAVIDRAEFVELLMGALMAPTAGPGLR